MGIVGSPILSAGGVIDVKEAYTVANSGANIVAGDSPYTVVETGSVICYVDTTAGPITINPNAAPEAEDRLKVIDVAGTADTNIITITGLGTIESEKGSKEYRYSGSAWQLLEQSQGILVRDASTGKIRTVSPDILVASELEAGAEASTETTTYAEFQNPGLNIDDDGSSYGNELTAGNDDESDGKSFTYSGGASVNGHDDSGVTYDYPANFSNYATGLVYDIDLGAGNAKAINELYIKVGGGQSYYFDYQLSWSDDGVSWSPIFSYESNIFNTNDRIFQFVNGVGAKRYWQVAIAYPSSELEIKKKVHNIKIRENTFVTTSNKVETESLSARTVAPASCVFYDEADNPITAAGKANIEWTEDGGSSWSTQEDLNTFLARTTNILSAGGFRFRLQPVGDERFKAVDVVGPAAQWVVDGTSARYVLNGVTIFEVDAIGGTYFTRGLATFRTPETVSGTSHTLVNSNNGKSLICTNASLTTVTIDDGFTIPNEEVEFEIVADGAAGVSLAVGGSATINGGTTSFTIAQYKSVMVRRYATNNYRVYGDFT